MESGPKFNLIMKTCCGDMRICEFQGKIVTICKWHKPRVIEDGKWVEMDVQLPPELILPNKEIIN